MKLLLIVMENALKVFQKLIISTLKLPKETLKNQMMQNQMMTMDFGTQAIIIKVLIAHTTCHSFLEK